MRSSAIQIVVPLALCAATVAHARRSIGSATRGQIRNIEGAIGHYRIENDSCPQSLDELVQRKYLASAPRDAWGRRFWFRCLEERDSDGADVVSTGADGVLGSDDDITRDRTPAIIVMPRVGWHERIGALAWRAVSAIDDFWK